MSKQMQDAYIVASTRTAVGKAPRGAYRSTRPDTLLAHVLQRVLVQVPIRWITVMGSPSTRGRLRFTSGGLDRKSVV